MNTSDVIVVGGGLVGMSVAYGLARQGARVNVLDEGDDAFRASRGNFGLVWVQGKGFGFSPYTRWTRHSASQWPTLAGDLQSATGVDLQLRQPGGFTFLFSEEEAEERRRRMQSIQDEAGGDYPYQILDRSQVKEIFPHIGPKVIGACYTPMDGHVNPLKLLRALHEAGRRGDVDYQPNQSVTSIRRDGGRFVVESGSDRYEAPKVVLAAGLGNRALAKMVGLHAPVAPNRGQVLISERTQPFLAHPTMHVRQTDEGTIQVGDSMEDVGFNDVTTTDVIGTIAQRAVNTFPILGSLNLVRAWSALRVMSPDGFPIYQESPSQPGAFVVTCHSGVTLAANHVFLIAPWIAGGKRPEGIEHFSGDRFLNSDKTFSHGH
jgi:glycine/D-amino acid oxidase-like deaminating enzyme